MASLEEIERKQKAMQPLLEQIAEEKDPDRIQELGKRIAEMAQELGSMAEGLEHAYTQARGGSGETRVVLTRDQRQRISDATGGAIDVLVLPGAEVWDPQMPRMSPATIERLALASIAERKLKEERRKAARQIVDELEAAVGADPAPETRAAIDRFKRDQLGE
ncbi:MAG TPA: hypothetical protein VG496_00680 [Myxococcales bacterium]|nr:hypothetical protein [Myxococcales bacterium]